MFSIGRTLSFAAAAVIAAVSLTACTDGKKKSDDGRLSIVCTSFSEYDWTRNIIGSTDSADVTYLLKSGVDMHNYQPSTEDMLAVSDCDMLIYVGGSSEVWVDSALENKRNDDMKVLRLFDVLGQDIKEEELKDGMEDEMLSKTAFCSNVKLSREGSSAAARWEYRDFILRTVPASKKAIRS